MKVPRYPIQMLDSHGSAYCNYECWRTCISMGWYKKDVTALLTHWEYILLALTHRYIASAKNRNRNFRKFHKHDLTIIIEYTPWIMHTLLLYIVYHVVWPVLGGLVLCTYLIGVPTLALGQLTTMDRLPCAQFSDTLYIAAGQRNSPWNLPWVERESLARPLARWRHSLAPIFDLPSCRPRYRALDKKSKSKWRILWDWWYRSTSDSKEGREVYLYDICLMFCELMNYNASVNTVSETIKTLIDIEYISFYIPNSWTKMTDVNIVFPPK